MEEYSVVSELGASPTEVCSKGLATNLLASVYSIFEVNPGSPQIASAAFV